MNELPSVDVISRDLPGILGRFRDVSPRAFSFGDGRPEAVLLTYDEFEDLGGEAKFDAGPSVLEPAQLAAELPRLLTAIRVGGSPSPVVWGEEGEPEAVVLSTAQYRELRGDDEPPAGVVDDPTHRAYSTKLLPDSVPFSLDDWAEGDPFTQEILKEIRTEEGLPPRQR
jgi:PHD/YefM family antitoxin component YafN of YafNO toxin-antitoxin module